MVTLLTSYRLRRFCLPISWGMVVPTFWERLIHAVKLQQLSDGGSWVSVESCVEAFGVEGSLPLT